MKWPAKEVAIVSGTPYHTGDLVQYEKALVNELVAAGVNAKYYYTLDLTVNGWFRFFARHHIGSSALPHTRGTAQKRSKLWKLVNAGLKNTNPPNLCVFGHTHFYSFEEDAFGATVILPCWQGPGGRFGETKCDGHIDIGAFRVTIGSEKGDWSWQKKLYPVEDTHKQEFRSESGATTRCSLKRESRNHR